MGFNIDQIRRHVPKGRELPARFDDFLRANLPFRVEWNDLDAYGLKPSAGCLIRDGCSKVYTLSSAWWSMDFRIERNGNELSITYLDFGEWYPVPAKYKLAEDVWALLKLVKNKQRRRYELSTCSTGIVSVNRDRDLALVPPDG